MENCKCYGPYTCKTHDGEYRWCSNFECICHQPKPNNQTLMNETYQPRDVKEAQYGIDQMGKGFSQGYHQGLKEGYVVSRYPERCHCCHCRNHGELCNEIKHL